MAKNNKKRRNMYTQIHNGMLKFLFFLLFIMTINNLYSQNNFTHKSKIKLLFEQITNNYHKIKTDTTYVARPSYNWLLLPKVNLKGNNIHFITNKNNIPTKYILESALSTTCGLSVSYKGLGLGFSINPTFFKKHNNVEYIFNFYNNHFGIDGALYNLTEFKGHIAPNRANSVKISGTHLYSISLNGYYVFNNKKF